MRIIETICFLLITVLIIFLLHFYKNRKTESDKIICGFYGENVIKNKYLEDIFKLNGGTLKGIVRDKKIVIKIKRVYTGMCRDKSTFPRYAIYLIINNKNIAWIGHTDIPFTFNIWLDDTKYRIICNDNI